MVDPTSDEVLLINLKDILFRTLVMLIFMLAIYIITAIGEKMSNERAAELNMIFSRSCKTFFFFMK